MKKIVVIFCGIIILIGVSILLLSDSPSNNIDTVAAFVKDRDTREIVKDLENDLNEKIIGAVWQNGIELQYKNETKWIYDDKDEFYVSIAPYINNTHG